MNPGVSDVIGDDDDVRLGLRAVSDPSAFDAIYRRHYRMIAAYLYRRCGDVDTAEDLAGEVFLAAFRSVGAMNRKAIAPKYWLLRIATNAASKRERDKRRRVKREAAHAVNTAAAAGAAGNDGGEATWTESQLRVRQAVDVLPEKFEAVVSLHYFAGLSVEEISRAIDVPEGTVKSRLARGREMVREGLENSGGAR
jgi:RNA polymerase sigma-70 factor (ECF subfamily)